MEIIYLILKIILVWFLFLCFIFLFNIKGKDFSDETLVKIANQMDELTKGLFSKHFYISLAMIFFISWLSSKIILLEIAIPVYIFCILFLYSIIVDKCNMNISLLKKRVIVLTNFIIGTGLLWNKYDFILLIGEKAIIGFHIESYVHDETGELISNYKTEHWIGETILDIFSFSYYPFIIIIIFLTWRCLQKRSK